MAYYKSKALQQREQLNRWRSEVMGSKERLENEYGHEISTESARSLLRSIFEPTWRERVEDWYYMHINYHWVVWIGDYHDDCHNFEQKLARILRFNNSNGSMGWCGREECPAYPTYEEKKEQAKQRLIAGIRSKGQ